MELSLINFIVLLSLKQSGMIEKILYRPPIIKDDTKMTDYDELAAILPNTRIGFWNLFESIEYDVF